jgi:hypothetical protein
MDGNEDVGEDDTFSHCGESVGSPVPVPERRAGALQLVLVDRGWCSCWPCQLLVTGVQHTRGEGNGNGNGKERDCFYFILLR